jgi:2-dehydro-3-deoxygluconokinase
MFDWRQIFADAGWFHWSGITPAISQSASEVTLEAVQAAKEMGLTVSCDWNYRQKLWRWGKSAGDVMTELMPYCDVIVANEEHARILFGIELPESLPATGKQSSDRQFALCEVLAQRFPNLQQIAVTQRAAVSASHNTIGGALWDRGQFYIGPTYDVTHIVDRVGGGDAFTAGLLYGLLAYGDDRQKAIDFGVAANCLKHSIFGDFNLVSVAEVENIMSGNVSGRVSR